MAARCFVDSCGVSWTEVITGSGPAFQADTVLDPDGGIICTEDIGLGVSLLNNVPADVLPARECANILQRNSAGQLHAVIPNSLITTVTPAILRSIPNNGSASGTSQTTVITNTTGCAALLVLRGQFEVNWEIADTVGGAIPALNANYNALLQMSLKFNGTPVDVQYLTVGGQKPVAGQCFLKDWRDISYIQAMTAGQAITITDEVVHDLTDIGIRRNFAANIATVPPNFQTGYRVVLTADILPIGAV